MNIQKIIIPTPYAVGDVNTYLLKGDLLTLVDAGVKTDEAREALQRGIMEAGYQLTDIDQVLLTHHHPDHAGLVDLFPQATIIAHRYLADWLTPTQQYLTYRFEFYKLHLQRQGVPEPYFSKILEIREEIEEIGSLPLTISLEHGEEVPGHPGLIAYYAPGHAQSHLIFYEAASQTLIGGDLILEKVSSNPLVEPPVDHSMERPKSLLQYNESLRFIQKLNPKIVYPGHGEDVLNANELIESRFVRQSTRAEKVLTMLDEAKTVFEVTKLLFPKVYNSQIGLTLSETQGQLDYLVDQGRITANLQNEVVYYKKA
jgi:glyoxylase-like metal-dependent hydrolase (beta-lactamase superfamily II)